MFDKLIIHTFNLNDVREQESKSMGSEFHASIKRIILKLIGMELGYEKHKINVQDRV